MINKINVKLMKNNVLQFLIRNSDFIAMKVEENPHSSSWLGEKFKNDLYDEKKISINDFELKEEGDYKNIRVDNAIILYEALNQVPRNILSDERFWLWIYFDKAYIATLKAMPLSSGKNIFKNHWLFTHGKRRGIFFGVLSRDFFVVDLTVDETLVDKYEYSKYALENFERVRNLLWRSYSSQKHIVLGVLKAHKDINRDFGHLLNVDSKWHNEIAVEISKYGGTKMLDILSEEEIKTLSYKFFKEKIEEYLNSI